MSRVSFEQVTKNYPTKKEDLCAVRELTLAVESGELLVLLGPSGCGKTTTLRLLAGLEEPTRGMIRISERDMSGVAPKDRDVALVFQDHALYPHMDVFGNLAFGLKMRAVAKNEIQQRVLEAAAQLHIEPLLNRSPGSLSGGERQRVALGRALARRPAVFLLDEPLSSLDAPSRSVLRTEIRQLQQLTHTTMIYVTHDQEEAMMLADRIVVMNGGVAEQVGTPDDVYSAPANRLVAGFVGSPTMNFLQAELELENGRLYCQTSVGRFEVPWTQGAILRPLPKERSGVIGIRPEDIEIIPGGVVGGPHDESPKRRATAKGFWSLPASRVELVEPLGYSTIAHLIVCDAVRLVARLHPSTSVTVGESVSARVDVDRVHLFADQGEGRRLSRRASKKH